MDASDFAFIEERLRVVLPLVFNRFMMSLPNDTTDQLQNTCDELPCNSELFAIRQLQRFFNPDGFDYYELQPNLRLHRFIEIGGDGCGNYFCMRGDDIDSDELWIWEHDPYNGLRKLNDCSLSDYFNRESWELMTCPNPFDRTTGVYVVRSDHPIRAVLRPIRLEEWRCYLARRNDLELDENHIATNPFTKEEVVFQHWPGRAKLKLDSECQYISYSYGALLFGESVSSAGQACAEQIAADLNGHVWMSK